MSAHINLQNVSLTYPVYDCSVMSLRKKITNLASAGSISGSKNNNSGIVEVLAIKNLSLNLQSGDKLAVVGGNGAGKSSLLKLISGIYKPTSGVRDVSGKITTILGTGFGLDEEATGYENIILGCLALGYTLKESKIYSEDVAEFSDLGNFLSLPLRTYSAGMRARIAFGIATAGKPDIIIIDEGIGAGDASFIEKANKRLESFLDTASLLVIASHSNDLLEKFCNKCLYMNHGEQVFFGPLEKGLEMYGKSMLL